jgi:hypothetical protein
MTALTKNVRRISSVIVREQGRPRNVVVILRPNGLIGFRAAGCRREYSLPIDAAYTLAVRATVLADKKARAQARKQNGGKR